MKTITTIFVLFVCCCLVTTPHFSHLLADPGIVFSDDFNRPDSNNVGGGWREIELEPSDAVISGGRLLFPDRLHGAVAYHPHGGRTRDVTIEFDYGFSEDPNRQADAFNLLHGGSRRGAGGGLFVLLENDVNRVRIIDGEVDLDRNDFVFELGTDYEVRWDVFADHSLELRVWPSGSAPPAAPLLVVAPFTPRSEGANWAFSGRVGGVFDNFIVRSPAEECCELDEDGDGVPDDTDNCPLAANADQADLDTDGLGDVCDACPLDPDNDGDGDGVCGDEDNCDNSDLSPTVVIDGCDSGVVNILFDDGCTISDLIAECAAGAKNHGQFVSCVAQLVIDLRNAGAISNQAAAVIIVCAALSNVP